MPPSSPQVNTFLIDLQSLTLQRRAEEEPALHFFTIQEHPKSQSNDLPLDTKAGVAGSLVRSYDSFWCVKPAQGGNRSLKNMDLRKILSRNPSSSSSSSSSSFARAGLSLISAGSSSRQNKKIKNRLTSTNEGWRELNLLGTSKTIQLNLATDAVCFRCDAPPNHWFSLRKVYESAGLHTRPKYGPFEGIFPEFEGLRTVVFEVPQQANNKSWWHEFPSVACPRKFPIVPGDKLTAFSFLQLHFLRLETVYILDYSLRLKPGRRPRQDAVSFRGVGTATRYVEVDLDTDSDTDAWDVDGWGREAQWDLMLSANTGIVTYKYIREQMEAETRRVRNGSDVAAESSRYFREWIRAMAGPGENVGLTYGPLKDVLAMYPTLNVPGCPPLFEIKLLACVEDA